MCKVLNQLGKNYSIAPKKFYNLKKKYLGLYKAKLLEAYDLGYTNEVSVFSESDFYEAYADEGIHLTFLNGKVKLEPWVFHVEWLLSGKTNDFYLLMRDLLEYRLACSSVDIVYDGLKVYKAKSSKSLSWGVNYSRMGLRGTSRSAQLNKYTYNLLIDDSLYFEDYIMRSPLSFGLEELLYWGSKYLSSLDLSIDSEEVFRGLTVDDLGEYLEDFLLGGIELSDGKLKDFMSESVDSSVAVAKLYALGKEDFFKYLDEVDGELQGKGQHLIGVDNFHLYIPKEKDDYFVEEIPIGAFSVDFDSSEVLPLVNNLYGITGDFLRVDSPLLADDYVYTGCPIYLIGSNGSESLYVDVEQVYGLGESSLIFDLGMGLTFSPKGSHTLEKEFGLVDFYVNGFRLQDEGVFTRKLKGYHSSESKVFAIRKASKLLGID